MGELNTENYKIFESYIKESGNTYAYSGDAAVKVSAKLFDIVKDMGLNPMITDEFKRGLVSLFNIEVINAPDMVNNRYIFAPNHVSDFDAIVLGLLIPNVRIVAKTDWTNNEKLKDFLNAHYNLYGLERTSMSSIKGMLNDAVNYFKSDDENKHYLLFSQGTISDFNNNSPERISSALQKISVKADVPIVNMFIEQVSIYHPTRIVFDEPRKFTSKDNFSEIWLERVKTMQNSLEPVGRRPVLSNKHSNNNKAGDMFF